MTPQQRFKTKLETVGIPYKDIEVYGSQIVITCWSKGATQKWIPVLCKFSKIRGTTESFDDAKKNKGTCLLPTKVKVYRVFARIGT